MHPLRQRPEPPTPTSESTVWEITFVTPDNNWEMHRIRADNMTYDDVRLMVYNAGQLVFMIPLTRFISAIRPDAHVEESPNADRSATP